MNPIVLSAPWDNSLEIIYLQPVEGDIYEGGWGRMAGGEMEQGGRGRLRETGEEGMEEEGGMDEAIWVE